jgi:hypothetical protein
LNPSGSWDVFIADYSRIVGTRAQVTAFYNELKSSFPKNSITGSEYLGFDVKPGSTERVHLYLMI